MTRPVAVKSGSAFIAIPFQAPPHLSDQRKGTLLLAFSEDPQASSAEIDVTKLESTGLTGTKTAPVCDFEEGPVPEPQVGVFGTNRKETLYLPLIQDLRQVAVFVRDRRQPDLLVRPAVELEEMGPGAERRRVTLNGGGTLALKGQLPQERLDLVLGRGDRIDPGGLAEAVPPGQIADIGLDRILAAPPFKA
jgi:hypothetical protein